MGDRYIISVRCDHCGEMNEDIYYAESSGFTAFVCEYCNKENEIVMSFGSRKRWK